MTARRSIVKTTLLLLPLQIVFRAGEALLPLLLAMWFGRTNATDVYYFAWAVFALAGALVFSAYQDSALVPILAEVRMNKPGDVATLVGSLLAHTLVVASALAAVIALGALAWFRVRYEGDDFALSVRMIVPFAGYLVALTLKTFLGAILSSEHRFFPLPIASALGMATTIGIIVGARHAMGVVIVPVASLAGEVVAIAVLAWTAFGLAKIGVRLNFSRPEPARRFARLIASEVGGSAVTRINPVVDQLMAVLAMVVGGGTLLRYSGDVASLPTSILQVTLLPVLLSHLAEDFAARDVAKIRATVRRAVLAVIAILLAVAAILYVLRAPLLRFVFLRGEMDAGGVDRMISLLPYHLVGLAPFGVLLVLARAHVAVQNSRIMLSMGILNAALNAIFNVVLLKAIGLEGIALSTSCVQLAIAIVFWFRFEARLGGHIEPVPR